MRESASKAVHVSWVAGDPYEKLHITHDKAPPKMIPSSKYIILISINYTIRFLASPLYCIVSYVLVYEHVVKWHFRLVPYCPPKSPRPARAIPPRDGAAQAKNQPNARS